MYYQQIEFIFKCMPLLCRLPLCRINGDHDITKGNSLCERLYRFALELAEGKYVRRPIRSSVFSIQLPYAFIIHEHNTYFGRFAELLNLQRLLCGPYQPLLIHRSRPAILY